MYEPILHLQLDLWSEFCESDTLFTKNRALVYMPARFFFAARTPQEANGVRAPLSSNPISFWRGQDPSEANGVRAGPFRS